MHRDTPIALAPTRTLPLTPTPNASQVHRYKALTRTLPLTRTLTLTLTRTQTLILPDQVHRYKALLQKQRDIMIALTARLNERDEALLAMQETPNPGPWTVDPEPWTVDPGPYP